ncbi:phosphogluconate dehydrogenase C-terminal domain-containing protein [Salinispira pacifica]
MKLALMGAGGKMGCRITDALSGNRDYEVSHVEIAPAGIARLKERGVAPVPQEQALESAAIVVLAIPDVLIGKVAREIVPKLKAGTIVVGLDPAAAFAGVLPQREDITYFICHPTHPPLFNDETDPKARVDWFGGIAKQNVVCALFQGPEEHYQVGEKLVRQMFRPIINTYRITVEQMAILEPALVETFTSTLVVAMKEAYDEAIKLGVPEDAAHAFLMGHLRIQFAVIFGYADFPFSDGALYAISKAKDLIFKPDWKSRIMNLDSIKRSVAEITQSTQRQ